jgi:hypothetical protein
MTIKSFRSFSEGALMVALVFGGGAVAQAQEDEAPGPVVQIGEADEGVATNFNETPNVERPVAPKYWIGLAGSAIPADHVLRAHVDLPEGQGLLVADVVPDSPAVKAGLKKHDILLRANDIDLVDMGNLTDIVLAEGEKKGQINIEVFRKGQRETVTVTPGERPATAMRPNLPNEDFGGFGALDQQGIPRELLERFRGGLPMEFRNFGPGVIVGEGSQGIGNIPNGVSVSISKDGDKPAHITVKRGDESWEVSADDPASLDKLPEDLRPFVEKMLHGASPFDLHMEGHHQLMPELGDGRLRERIERMEQRMQEMVDRLEKQNQPAPNVDETK